MTGPTANPNLFPCIVKQNSSKRSLKLHMGKKGVQQEKIWRRWYVNDEKNRKLMGQVLFNDVCNCFLGEWSHEETHTDGTKDVTTTATGVKSSTPLATSTQLLITVTKKWLPRLVATPISNPCKTTRSTSAP